jgi:hypothetical protein
MVNAEAAAPPIADFFRKDLRENMSFMMDGTSVRGPLYTSSKYIAGDNTPEPALRRAGTLVIRALGDLKILVGY